MSNAELVRALFDDFNRGDSEAALTRIHEDVEWDEPPDMPDTGGTYVGHEGMVKGFTRFMGAWETLRVDVEELIERGDRVIATTHWVGTSRSAGIEVDQRVAQVYELEDGKVRRLRQFRTLDEALAAP